MADETQELDVTVDVEVACGNRKLIFNLSSLYFVCQVIVALYTVHLLKYFCRWKRSLVVVIMIDLLPRQIILAHLAQCIVEQEDKKWQ